MKFGTLTLKRGAVAGANEYAQWRNTIALHKSERRDVTISLLNEAHKPIRTW
jgi:hypothetical protein